jgi:hypothetical protein
MNLDKIIMGVGKEHSGYPSIEALVAASAMANASLTPEEKAERRSKREELEKKRRLVTMVRQGICPICGSKLHRGKKDKKNDYKRSWDCTTCGSIHSI